MKYELTYETRKEEIKTKVIMAADKSTAINRMFNYLDATQEKNKKEILEIKSL